MRTTPNGIPMCRFSIAVDRKFARQGEERQADFFEITAWRQTAEFVCRWFSKGRAILVEGTLQNNNYTDNNGVKHYSMNIIADNVSFCGDKRSDNGGGNGYNGGGYNNGGGNGYNGGGYNNGGNGYNGNGYNNGGNGYNGNGYNNGGNGYNGNGYNNGGNGGYHGNGYNNGGNGNHDGGYSDSGFQMPEPPEPPQSSQDTPSDNEQKTVQLGNIGDFQTIISDGNVPF